MTSECIQWARLEDLNPVVAALDFPAASYVYLERVPDCWLSENERQNGLRLERFEAGTDFNGWERGRLFCEAFELCWERLDGAFQTVYVGPRANLPGFSPAEDVDLGATDCLERGMLLWGTPVPADEMAAIGAREVEDLPAFLDFQIPRLLRYPVSSGTKRVRLLVREYRDRESHRRVYYRFKGLEER